MTTQAVHLLEELYARLAAAQSTPMWVSFAEAHGRMGWPTSGVYFIREPGELRTGVSTPRIVRVGTHALTATSKAKVWGRLRTHRGSAAGADGAAGGNHRGSIFRRHVGSALIARDGFDIPARTWGVGSSAPKEIRSAEGSLEAAVSDYIGAMSFLVIDVPDRFDRGRLERTAIALLSNLAPGVGDPPSPSWLGHRAAHPAVRSSGLWNVNHVSGEAIDTSALELIG